MRCDGRTLHSCPPVRSLLKNEIASRITIMEMELMEEPYAQMLTPSCSRMIFR